MPAFNTFTMFGNLDILELCIQYGLPTEEYVYIF